ncbi:MAG: SAM-dependent methyltransferase [Ramlibacter sp.]|nr:SAM-dependent methyltransferase [Ramlibacter sp.]
MQPVSLTAQWTAAIRAIESERPQDALFQDSLARHLAQPDGFSLLDRRRGGGVKEFVIIRTRYFDDASLAAVDGSAGIRQLVLIAAGMDARAYRLNWPQNTRIFELDHAPLLEEKARRLDAIQASPKAARVPVPVDLVLDWSQALLDAGFDRTQPTLWLVEGLLFFLTQEQVQTVLGTCRRLSAAHSRMVVDMISASLLRSPLSQSFLASLRRDHMPWQFGTDEPEAFLASLGWTVLDLKEPGMAGAGGSRWPYPLKPRNIPGIARSWLLTAELARK